jgi:hypothetical protein
MIVVFDPTLSRPVRVCFFFSGALFSLAVTVYFGDQLSLVRGVMIAVISAVVTSVFSQVYYKTLGSGTAILKLLGVVVYLGVNLLCVYIIMSVVATTSTVEKTNQWTIQYGIS